MREPIIFNTGKELVVKLDTEWLSCNNFSFTSEPLEAFCPEYCNKDNGDKALSREYMRYIKRRMNEKLQGHTE